MSKDLTGAENEALSQGFAPILSDDVNLSAQILILGSMPGQKSLQEHQYYAHPQNAFWWIMSELLKFDLKQTYQQRVEALLNARVAVWDVLAQCSRPGSLDSNIKRASEVPNDIAGLLSKQATIKAVFFNGKTAGQSFWRHHRTIKESLPTLEYVDLPSTSPAYASMHRHEKMEQWRRVLEFLSPSS
ncbi:MAG: DNA-deoxyinosine glycosylase [Arenicella sp.]